MTNVTLKQYGKRAVIYARYSSDKQRASSIEDQARNCRHHAAKESLTILDTYADEAVSGTTKDREAYQRMLQAAAQGEFDVLLVDDLSRLSRDDIEMKKVIRDFSFRRLRIIGVSDGYDSTTKGHKIHAGMKGLMNELYIDDLREKTHRGMTGQALKGYNCGGRTYGYRNVPIEDATRKDQYGRPVVTAVRYEIHEEQAEWVRKIFKWWVEGKSYRSIAFHLNDLGVPSSRNSTWAVSAVKVILENEMYCGQVIWNRRQWEKDPETGKRLYRERPKSEWVVTPAPELQIISPELWEASLLRRPKNYDRASFAPNLRYLFSGLMECGECSGSFVIVAKGRFGCANAHRRGKAVCTNSVTVSHKIVESRLLSGLKEHMLSDEAFDLFCKHAESLMSQPNTQPNPKHVEKQLRLAEKQHGNLINAIKDGLYTKSIGAELEAIEQHIDDLKSRLSLAVKPQSIKRVLPKARERFNSAIKHLEDTLSMQANAAREQLKQLIDGKISVRRNGDCLEAEMGVKTPEFLAKSMGKEFVFMVAGARFELTTFRL